MGAIDGDSGGSTPQTNSKICVSKLYRILFIAYFILAKKLPYSILENLVSAIKGQVKNV